MGGGGYTLGQNQGNQNNVNECDFVKSFPSKI